MLSKIPMLISYNNSISVAVVYNRYTYTVQYVDWDKETFGPTICKGYKCTCNLHYA